MKRGQMLPQCFSPPDSFHLCLQASNKLVQFHPAMLSLIRLSAQAQLKEKVILSINFNLQELIVISVWFSRTFYYIRKKKILTLY